MAKLDTANLKIEKIKKAWEQACYNDIAMDSIALIGLRAAIEGDAPAIVLSPAATHIALNRGK